MKSDRIEREVENCLRELRSICEHSAPPPARWQKVKQRCSQLWSEHSDAVLGWAIWLSVIIGLPMLVSMCHSNRSPEPSSPHRDVVAQYTVTYYAEGAQEWEEVTDDQ